MQTNTYHYTGHYTFPVFPSSTKFQFLLPAPPITRQLALSLPLPLPLIITGISTNICQRSINPPTSSSLLFIATGGRRSRKGGGLDRSIDRSIGRSVGFVNEAVYAEHDIAYSDNLAPLVRIMRETEYTRSYYTRSTDLYRVPRRIHDRILPPTSPSSPSPPISIRELSFRATRDACATLKVVISPYLSTPLLEILVNSNWTSRSLGHRSSWCGS